MEDSKIIDAIQYAHKMHLPHKRRHSGSPYILHPMRVAAAVALLPEVTPDMVCAAWLHDVPEDCAKTHEEQGVFFDYIAASFSQTTATLVKQLTNPTKFSKEPRSLRKALDRESISIASFQAKQIKAIDRIDNLLEFASDLNAKRCLKDEYRFAERYCDESDLLALCLKETGGLYEELQSAIHRCRLASGTRFDDIP